MKLYTEQLATAWHLVERGSRAAGVDGITVDLFKGIAREQIRQLFQQMRQERYVASPAKGFYLPKKSGGRRLIGIPTVRDRIVQRHLLQSAYPKLEQAYSDWEHVRFAENRESTEDMAIVTPGSIHDSGAKSPTATTP